MYVCTSNMWNPECSYINGIRAAVFSVYVKLEDVIIFRNLGAEGPHKLRAGTGIKESGRKVGK